MFVNFSEETQHILKQAQKEKDDLNHPYVGSEHLMLSILKNDKLKEILKKNKITYERFKKELISIVGVGKKKTNYVLYTPLLKKILQNAILQARDEKEQKINPSLLLITILDEEDGIAYSILKKLNINIEKLYFDIRSVKQVKGNKRKKLLLEELGMNLTKQAKMKKLDPVIGREDEIKKTIEILLRRKKNNPILIGPAGVGKTAIVEGIANLMVSDDSPCYLQNKTIISLNVFSLVSGTKYRGEFEEKMKIIIKELEENDDIILFIDEIHTIVGAGGAEGAIDASNILKPALARGVIKIIGATTIDEYKKFIEPDAALTRRFQKVTVDEPSLENVIKILNEIKPLYENYHNIKIPSNIINDIVTLSDKYLTNRYEPDRSIDILDEVCAKSSILETKEDKIRKNIIFKLKKIRELKIKALSNNSFSKAYDLKQKENNLENILNNIKPSKRLITKKNVLEVIKNKGNIKTLNINNRIQFYNILESDLNSIIIGQEKNIKELIKILKLKDISKHKKIYSVLITGELYSGKTTLSKEYLKKIVGEKNIIYMNLFDYKEYHTISKLIGTTAGYLGYDNKNNIFEKIRTSPSSALLIDNFEKACDEVKEMFFKILENGYVEDASGRLIDFTNTIIIFNSETEKKSKVGFEKSAKGESDDLLDKLENYVSLKIEMNSISKDEKLKILNKKINSIISEYADIDVILEKGYSEKVLCNKMNNKLINIDSYLNKNLENLIIDALIDNKKMIKIGFDSNIVQT